MTIDQSPGFDHHQARTFRVDYKKGELHEGDIITNPFIQFQSWFHEAVETGLIEPNAMTIATADKSGRLSARVVLLKAFDPTGFVFYTNYESRKGREIEENPRVAALFYWDQLQRVVRVEGLVARLLESESDEYFASRPRDAQIGAWASKQSTVIPSRAYLDEEIRRYQDQFGEGQVSRPPFWGGYRITPDSFEFWQGRANRLHDRLFYSMQEDRTWSIQRLSP